MPRYDAHHEAVKTALLKDGWTITHDPFVISVGGRRLLADLGAEKVLNTLPQAEKVAIEIKVLDGASLVMICIAPPGNIKITVRYYVT